MATILVVDDRPTNRELLVTLLGHVGHRVLEAVDGVEALATARVEHPDLIIADLIMPAMDGYELARQVRSDPAIGQTQIIFHTASYELAEARRLALACGVAYFMPKPSEPQPILDIVNAALAARAAVPVPPVSEAFYHEHMRLLTNTLARKVEDLEAEVAQREQAQAALWQSEEQYRTLVDTAGDVILLTDAAGKALLRNKAYYNSLGFTAAEGTMLDGFDRVHPDDVSRLRAGLAGLLANGTGVAEYRIQHRDGRWIHRSARSSLIYDEDHQPKSILTFITDVTARKQAEELLAQERDLLRTLIDHLPDAIYVKDSHSRFVIKNLADALKMGAATPEETIGKSDFDYYPPDLAAQYYADDQSVIVSGQAIVNREEPVLDATGRPGWVSTTKLPLRDRQGNVIGLVGIGHDITERKRAADESKLFRALVEQSNDAIDVIDPETGHYLDSNEKAWRDLGYSREEYLSLAVSDVDPNVDPASLRKASDDVRQSGALIYESQRRRKDGSAFPVEVNLKYVDLDRGYIVAVARDISERMHRRHELEAIADVSTSLRSAQTRAELVPLILDKLLILLHASGTALDMYDSLSGEAVIDGARGAWAMLAGQRMPAGHGISAQVIATRQAYVSDDVTTDARFYPAARAEGIRAVACVPLIAHGQVIGGLWVGRLAPITPADLSLLTALADMAANAIHRASLFEQTEGRLRRLAALRAIDLAIGSSLDLHITFDVLLDQTISQLRVDAASVLLLSPHSHNLDYAAGRGFRSRAVERASLRLGQGLAGRVALERRMVAVPDLAQAEPGAALPAALSAEGFQAYYGVPLTAKGLVHGVLEVFQRAPLHPDSDWLEFLDTLASQAAIAVDNTQLFVGLQRSNVELSLAYESTIEGWSRALDLRDRETEGHTQRVTEITLDLARAMHIDDKELLNIRRGGLLHDIGKMGIPDSILLKPGPLTDAEWVTMRQHPVFAYQLLYPITYLRAALDIPYCHHEKWDGSGYPRGLKAEQIPLSARLFAVVDVWDALRSDRPYRAGWPANKVREYIRSLSGTHFDPAVVEVFLSLVNDESSPPI